jgi:hypothetical protein
MKLNHGIAVAIAALPLTALPALVADYCITQTGIVSGTYVGKDFTPPKAGDCKAAKKDVVPTTSSAGTIP